MPTSCPMTRGACAWRGCAWWISLNEKGTEGVCAIFKIAIELENLRKLKTDEQERELEKSKKRRWWF